MDDDIDQDAMAAEWEAAAAGEQPDFDSFHEPHGAGARNKKAFYRAFGVNVDLKQKDAEPFLSFMQKKNLMMQPAHFELCAGCPRCWIDWLDSCRGSP